MLKRTIIHSLARYGYEIRRIPHDRKQKPEQSFTLYKYVSSDGSFDYDRYRATQIEGNREKLDHVWVIEKNMAFVADYIQRVVGEPQFGICHGTRRGKEQEWLRRDLECEVIGTEISDTAAQFPHTIQWDFHETKPEWIGATDFIYSNSFDHSYDPQKCLDAWMSCLRAGGVCVLEHSSDHGPLGTSPLDPFGADLVAFPYLIALWGGGKYGVSQILEAPQKRDSVSHLHFIVIQNF